MFLARTLKRTKNQGIEDAPPKHYSLRFSGPAATKQTRSKYDEKTQEAGGPDRLYC